MCAPHSSQVDEAPPPHHVAGLLERPLLPAVRAYLSWLSHAEDGREALRPHQQHRARFAAGSIHRLEAPSDDSAEAESLPESLLDELVTMEEKEKAPAASSLSPSVAGEIAEMAAEQLRKLIENHFKGGDFAEARQLYAEFKQKYTHSAAGQAKSLRRVVAQLEVVGQPAPSTGLSTVQQWLIPSAHLDARGPWHTGVPTLLYFWEMWCPHCRKYLKHMQELFTASSPKGLEVVGLTQMSRGVKEHSLRQLLSRSGITFPVGRESGDLSKRFAVHGIPAAALVSNATVVWRGHPAHLTGRVFARWLPGNPLMHR
eukprot:GGOE01019740.1.p1 GENE.GGOE01019740.1~~GGOE01019740.1.p1  ORF type:complete len:342 (-),score=60.60 GGOE01019740.1:198-1139(-)